MVGVNAADCNFSSQTRRDFSHQRNQNEVDGETGDERIPAHRTLNFVGQPRGCHLVTPHTLGDAREVRHASDERVKTYQLQLCELGEAARFHAERGFAAKGIQQLSHRVQRRF